MAPLKKPIAYTGGSPGTKIPMITVHHLENSRSQRILWLLEELELPYQIKRYARDPKTMLAPPELAAVHPLGKSPVITDGDVTVAESGAIIEYLVTRHGGGRLVPPAESTDRRRYTYWLHYAEGSLMPLMVMTLVFSRLNKPPMPRLMRPIAGAIAGGVQSRWLSPQIASHLAFIKGELAATGWFAGPTLTAADIQMSFPLEAAAARGGLDSRHPAIRDFLERVHARPAYRAALDKGGPYRLLQ